MNIVDLLLKAGVRSVAFENRGALSRFEREARQNIADQAVRHAEDCEAKHEWTKMNCRCIGRGGVGVIKLKKVPA